MDEALIFQPITTTETNNYKRNVVPLSQYAGTNSCDPDMMTLTFEVRNPGISFDNINGLENDNIYQQGCGQYTLDNPSDLFIQSFHNLTEADIAYTDKILGISSAFDSATSDLPPQQAIPNAKFCDPYEIWYQNNQATSRLMEPSYPHAFSCFQEDSLFYLSNPCVYMNDVDNIRNFNGAGFTDSSWDGLCDGNATISMSMAPYHQSFDTGVAKDIFEGHPNQSFISNPLINHSGTPNFNQYNTATFYKQNYGG